VTGVFSCAPSPQVANGTVLSVTATDSFGNTSAPAHVTVTAPIRALSVSLSSVTLHPGDTATATGTGFVPGEIVHGLMTSNPLPLGVQVADANGTVIFTWTIPFDTTLGIHDVTLTGEISGSVTGLLTIIPFELLPATLIALTGLPTAPLLPAAAMLLLLAGILVLHATQRRRHRNRTS
jgi:hypothetical protein